MDENWIDEHKTNEPTLYMYISVSSVSLLQVLEWGTFLEMSSGKFHHYSHLFWFTLKEKKNI
jgi:hypothetical protein